MRGASLECLACGEFVLVAGTEIRCAECESALGGRAEEEQLELGIQAS